MELGQRQKHEMDFQDNGFSGSEVTLILIDERSKAETKEVEPADFFGVDFISSQKLFRQHSSDFFWVLLIYDSRISKRLLSVH